MILLTCILKLTGFGSATATVANNLFLVKGLDGSLRGATDSDRELLRSWPAGEVLRCRVSKPRNSRFHRKFFVLLDIAFQNQDRYGHPEPFRKALILQAGFYDEIPKLDGSGVTLVPKSISFANMDELEFSKVYNRVRDLICTEVIGVEATELDQAVLEQLSEF